MDDRVEALPNPSLSIRKANACRETREEVIHIYMDGNMAVYTARLTIEGRYGGHAEHGEFRALDAWIRRDGRWQKLATQLTPINK